MEIGDNVADARLVFMGLFCGVQNTEGAYFGLFTRALSLGVSLLKTSGELQTGHPT